MIAIPLPNIGPMRGASGRARKEPFPAPFVDPGRSLFRCAQPILRRKSVTHGMLGGDSIRVFRLERRQPAQRASAVVGTAAAAVARVAAATRAVSVFVMEISLSVGSRRMRARLHGDEEWAKNFQPLDAKIFTS